tara:strand:+ start:10389 stop:11048 length:660 start_codon:yes stop_codon:yes gene_type:complete
MTKGVLIGQKGWTGAQLSVTYGAASGSFSYDAEIGDDGASIKTFSDAFIAWGNDAARPWSGSLSFSSSLDVSAHGLKLTLTASDSVTFTADTEAQDMLSVSASTVGATLTSSKPLLGTMSADVSVPNWLSFSKDDGVTVGSGSYAITTPSHGLKMTKASATATHAQAVAFCDGLASAYSPRKAHIYSEALSSWVDVNLLKADVSPASLSHYLLSMEISQ